MGEIFVHDFSVLGGRSGNSVKRGSYRHTAYVCFDKRLLLAKVLRWVSQFWGKQYTCSGKYFEVYSVFNKKLLKIHIWGFAFPILTLSSFGQDPRLRLATIFADEQIHKTREARGIFFQRQLKPELCVSCSSSFTAATKWMQMLSRLILIFFLFPYILFICRKLVLFGFLLWKASHKRIQTLLQS